MVTVTVLALVDIVWRLNGYNTEPVTPIGIVVLSVVIAVLVSLGATFGGTLVYDYGFNVETAGDSPVWHKSETDVLPGHHDDRRFGMTTMRRPFDEPGHGPPLAAR